MVWLEVSVETDGEAAEAVAEALRPLAYQNGVALEQRGDETSLDPEALEPQVTVKIYVPEDGDTLAFRRRVEEILYHLNRLYPVAAPVFRLLAEADWANAWKAHYHSFRVGRRLVVRPSWEEEESEEWRVAALSTTGGEWGRIRNPRSKIRNSDDVVVTLDPGMAFGTGLHPTTQSCLEALEQVVVPGMAVLDVGTGSGILAIAAVKLGATTVVGVDTDAVAVKTARANAAQNGVNDSIQVWQGSLASVPAGEWDVVVVNILATVIIQLLAEGGLMQYVAPAGYLVLSGIIDQQAAGVGEAIEESGGQVIQTFTVRDWVTYVVQHS
jgi:ribosomal protein L11 methyltransferase